MTKTTLICGSLAFDKIMQYHGRFADTLLADQLHRVNVSFLVPTLRTEYGGCAANIAYNLNMLGGDPLIMATLGQDGGEYLERFARFGIATRGIRTIADAYTAQCFVTADDDNNQINAFHPGAMQFSHENSAAAMGALRVAIIAPDGRDGMIKHAADLAAQGVPVMFDPGQQLPMFNGEELRTFIGQATYLAANDYEFEMVMERTGWTLDEIASRLDALIITPGRPGFRDFMPRANATPFHACRPMPSSTPPAAATPIAPACCTGFVNGYDWPTTGRLASVMGGAENRAPGGPEPRGDAWRDR